MRGRPVCASSRRGNSAGYRQGDFPVTGALETAAGNEYNDRKPAEGFPAQRRRTPLQLQSHLICRWGCSESVRLRPAEQDLSLPLQSRLGFLRGITRDDRYTRSENALVGAM